MPDFAMLADEVATAFGLGRALAPMRYAARGEQAMIWRLDTADGSFAVKQPHRGFVVRPDGVDLAFQASVLAQTDVPMPTPVRRPGGEFVASVAEHVVRVSTWVDLLPPDTGLDPTEVGRLLAALHQVDFPLAPDAQVDPWYRAPVGQPVWDELTQRLEASGAPFATTLRAELPHLLELEDLLEPPRDLRMCHCDLWADNVLRTASGEVCVIDWDNCGAADPSHELAAALFEFGQGESGRVRNLYHAYRTAGGAGRLERPGQLTMVIAQFGHFWQTAAESWLDPDATAADRAHAEDRVAELMSPPLTVQAVEELVSAVALA